MGSFDIEETKRKIKYVTSEMQKADWEGVENGLYDIVVHIQRDHYELSNSTPRNHDIALLIQEMRHGFDSMDKRFESMDKRFDDLIHQIDKRFDQVDKRFSSIQCFMGIGFTFFALIISYGTFFK
ncbi:MAG: hypothetical protein JJT78_04700 [Leptospira sp.]|nr:hypothetical protein [Leptospira sp.]